MRMISTFGEGFLSKVHKNRLRGNFVPLGSASGRFACHEPNLLALPNQPLFQACLVPESGQVILHFDYGAFELRILAALSQDKTLLAIFNDNRDIHSMVAKAVFNTPVSKSENAHLRDQAKILNFGIIYGMGEQALAQQLKISRTQANLLLHNYFARFKKVHEFLLSLEEYALQKGYIKTALGRRIYLPQDAMKDVRHCKRVARNAPIQGTGADIVKLALCKVFKRLYYEDTNARIVNVVHDELVIECAEKHMHDISALVKKEMESAFNTTLPQVIADITVTN